MMTLNQRLADIKPAATSQLHEQAQVLQASGQEIINLSVGEPHFPTPDYIKQAAIDALSNDQTHYAPVSGLASLRDAIRQKFKHDNGIDFDVAQILVTAGAKQAVFNALVAMLNPHDEVIIPAPYWPVYPEICKLMGAKPIVLPCPQNQHYKLSAKQLAAAITSNTRVFILNNPNNPSGMAYSHQELSALASVLRRYPNIIIISDEIYEHTLWHHKHHCFATIAPDLQSRTVITNGLSKTFCMTGWRVGYAAGPNVIIDAMKMIQLQSTTSTNTIAQCAATAALTNDKSAFLPNMLAYYKKNHDALFQGLTTLGADILPAAGTFYCFANISAWLSQLGLTDDIAVCRYLLKHCHLATTPGSAFGLANHLRFSFALEQAQIQKALKRLTQLFA